MAHHPVAQSFNRILAEMNTQFYERRPALEACVLATLAKEHVFILGPPGTGKSQMVRAFVDRILAAPYFEVLLSKTRPDQAILGPYDLLALKEGTFKRKIEGYLFTAVFAFLDEVGKMSPTTGHDLLAAANERIRHEVNGNKSTHPIPLHTIFGASNELPVNESEDAAAYWDRNLVRTKVDYLVETGNWIAMLASAVKSASAPSNRTTIEYADLADVVDNVIPYIPIPTDVLESLAVLKENLRSEGLQPSDRRAYQSMRVMQAAAFLAGRDQVETDDISVLRYTMWDDPDQMSKVERATLKIANPLNEESLRLLDDVNTIRAGVAERKGKSLSERAGYGSESLGKLNQIMSETGKLRQKCLAAGRSTTKVDEVLDDVKAAKRMVLVECLDTNPDDV